MYSFIDGKNIYFMLLYCGQITLTSFLICIHQVLRLYYIINGKLFNFGKINLSCNISDFLKDDRQGIKETESRRRLQKKGGKM